jgi:hypothetical protein
MNGKKAKALRRAARVICNASETKPLVRRYRTGKFETVGEERVEITRDTIFWPVGSYRQMYQELKRGTSA